ncbi:Ras-related protein Rab-7b [Tritrichomonas foetus]|uniref:Ras-related protein Rab-7b n=1 Tax=Tritrichomonas foetus TaxID=1144522 RepID=A0A1J4J9E6_9EUKA|nr:Ras-related protein Rab-7b [Tritrichomonas foetus]|eukprot:OHS94045.1 Ras-related protein Rab-7b [Tritrichomonas foetus]
MPLKIVFCGDLSSGKTCMIYQFVNGVFMSNSTPTHVTSSISHSIEVFDNLLNLRIWETSGAREGRAILSYLSRGANAAVLVIDSSNPQGCDKKDDWMNLVKIKCPNSCRFYVCANKSDLECSVPLDDIEKWCEKSNYRFFRLSAKDTSSVRQVFNTIITDFLGINPNSLELTNNSENKEEEQSNFRII